MSHREEENIGGNSQHLTQRCGGPGAPCLLSESAKIRATRCGFLGLPNGKLPKRGEKLQFYKDSPELSLYTCAMHILLLGMLFHPLHFLENLYSRIRSPLRGSSGRARTHLSYPCHVPVPNKQIWAHHILLQKAFLNLPLLCSPTVPC